MRPETRRRLDQHIWKRRAGIAFATTVCVVVAVQWLAYLYEPDPVVETRMVSGVVTNWTVRQTMGRGALVIWVSLDNGRTVTIEQLPHGLGLRYGPTTVEEQRHESGRMSYRWTERD